MKPKLLNIPSTSCELHIAPKLSSMNKKGERFEEDNGIASFRVTRSPRFRLNARTDDGAVWKVGESGPMVGLLYKLNQTDLIISKNYQQTEVMAQMSIHF
ncbi:hypothetical protein Q8A67_020274 [Cirrhinus molitorella]|uniref:Uncharacterized protein n=1 Tax=Cirrhinus molitorella TaxID=172907 RepID=A0AA88PBJ2_9TELE|nr:hypothetical protein Q8A67_020274 [Cirrhinus molitorella]